MRRFLAVLASVVLGFGFSTPANASSDYGFEFVGDFNQNQRQSGALSIPNTYMEIGERFYFIDQTSHIDLRRTPSINYLENDQRHQLKLPSISVYPLYLFKLGSELVVFGVDDTWVYDGSDWREINAPEFEDSQNELRYEIAFELQRTGDNRLFFTGLDHETGDYGLYYLDEGSSTAVDYTDSPSDNFVVIGYDLFSEDLDIGIINLDSEAYDSQTIDQTLPNGTASSWNNSATAIVNAWTEDEANYFITDGDDTGPTDDGDFYTYPDTSEIDDIVAWDTVGDMAYMVNDSGKLVDLDASDNNFSGLSYEHNFPAAGSSIRQPTVVLDDSGDPDKLILSVVKDDKSELEWFWRDISGPSNQGVGDTNTAFTKFASVSSANLLDPNDFKAFDYGVGIWGDRIVYVDDSDGDFSLKASTLDFSDTIDFGHPMSGQTTGLQIGSLSGIEEGNSSAVVFNARPSNYEFNYSVWNSEGGLTVTPSCADAQSPGCDFILNDVYELENATYAVYKHKTETSSSVERSRVISFSGSGSGQIIWNGIDDAEYYIQSATVFNNELWVSTLDEIYVMDESGSFDTAENLYPTIQASWDDFKNNPNLGRSIDGKVLIGPVTSGSDTLEVILVTNVDGTMVSNTWSFDAADNVMKAPWLSFGDSVFYSTDDGTQYGYQLDGATGISTQLGQGGIFDIDEHNGEIHAHALNVEDTETGLNTTKVMKIENNQFVEVPLEADYEPLSQIYSAGEKLYVLGQEKTQKQLAWFEIDGDQVTNLGWPETAQPAGFDWRTEATVLEGDIFFTAIHEQFGMNLYKLDLNLPQSSGPSFSAPSPSAGPVISSAELVGSNVVIEGSNLDLISKVILGESELSGELVNGKLNVDISSVESGSYELSFEYLGSVVQTDFTIELSSVDAQSSEPEFWTKQVSPSEIKLYAKNIVGAGKVQFFHNGNEVAWVNAEDASDPKLRVIESGPMTGANYLVRTREMVEGKNTFEIYVDGERVLRRAQGN